MSDAEERDVALCRELVFWTTGELDSALGGGAARVFFLLLVGGGLRSSLASFNAASCAFSEATARVWKATSVVHVTGLGRRKRCQNLPADNNQNAAAHL